jgi:hypothetical protein
MNILLASSIYLDSSRIQIINLSFIRAKLLIGILTSFHEAFHLSHYRDADIQLVKIAGIQNITMNLKHVALQLCTCTWIEIMTGAGIILYMLYLGNYTLAAITVAVFAPLIGFHFAVSKVQNSNVEWNPRRTIRLRP